MPSKVVPKGTGEAARSAQREEKVGPKSELNGPNAGQTTSNRQRRKHNRAKAFKADGNKPPPPLFPTFVPLAVSLSCARNGAQETRPPRSPNSRHKSSGYNKLSPSVEEATREHSPHQRGRTKEGEARIRPAGSMNRGRGMRAPDGPGPRKLTTGAVSHVLRNEESRRTVKKRAFSAEIRLAGLISRGQGMRAPAGLSPRELTAELATSALRSEENQLEMGAPGNANVRLAGSMNRVQGMRTPSGTDPRRAKIATGDLSLAPRSEDETRRKASDRLPLRIPDAEFRISGREMRAGKSTATLATRGGILGTLIREDYNRGSSGKGNPTAVETLGAETRPRESVTPGGGRT